MKWQPITTAPRNDGVHVLLHGNGEDFEGCTVVGWWCEDSRRWMPFDGCARLMPTHWLPLPAPPKERAELAIEAAAPPSYEKPNANTYDRNRFLRE
jgi:hypothetical protein